MGADSILNCGGLDCDLCSLLETITNSISWLLAISATVTLIFTVISGFLYFKSTGKKSLLFKAKRSFKNVILGFSVILLAWLIIHYSLSLLGYNNGNWWSFNCERSTSGIEEAKIGEIINSMKNSGEISGIISSKTTVSDLDRLYQNISGEDVIIFSSYEEGSINPWAILGKKSSLLEILYLDARKIKKLETSKGNIFFEEALAQEKNLLQEMALTIKGLIFQFVEGRKDQAVSIINRPQDLKIDPLDIPIRIPESMRESLTKVKNCISSGGVWFRFPDKCSFEKYYNPKTECGLGEKKYDSCRCPDNKFLTEDGLCN